jgi:uncharacterized membrane protein
MIDAPSPRLRRDRFESVDALRGGIMIIMALDHVRDFIHRGAMSGASPTDLATTTPILFMTRWITHLCAPTFMLTAGMGAYFYLQGRTYGQFAKFLITRGLWLIVLELTLMQLAYNFDISTSYPIFLLVLWALGACMIILAGLAWLPIRVLAALSIATIVLHHLADPVRAEGFWILLHQLGVIQFAGLVIISPYPLVPWCAVMSLGFCLGPVFSWDADTRRRFLLRAGIAMTIAFLVLRALNLYGDQSRWEWQPTAVHAVLSFLNTSKRPPSLDFVLMTIGPALMFLSWVDGRSLSRSNPLIVFGRVPLFYFVVHFVVAHLAIVVMSVAKYGTAALGFMFQPVPSMGGPATAFPPGFGYDLWVAYAVWIAIVAGLYPVCRWFAGVKERRRDWWLSYL